MLEEIGKSLGQWPILQFFFGATVLAVGTYVTIKGITGKNRDHSIQLEDKRLEWEAYERLRSIDESCEKIVENQRMMLDGLRRAVDALHGMTEQLKALSAAIWNRGV